MKKLLALVLALVMVMSLCITSNAAYTDAADIDYKEAVDVMTAIGVLEGSDGKFDPDGILTREQAAKIVSYLLLGKKAADSLSTAAAPFADVAADRWSAGAVAYCASEGIINGVGNGLFDPTGTLTGYQFAKMLLCACGYDADIEGMTGADWTINVAKLALVTDLADGLEIVMANKLSRQEAAKMALNLLSIELVDYTGGVKVAAGNNTTVTVGATRVGLGKTFHTAYVGSDLVKRTYAANGQVDEMGRPATKWTYKNSEVGTYAKTATITYTGKMTSTANKKVVKADLNDYTFGATVNEDYDTVDEVIEATGNGKIVEVFVDKNVITEVVVTVPVYTTVKKVASDKITLTYNSDEISDADKDWDLVKGFAKSDEVIVVYNAAGTKIVEAYAPTVVSGKFTAKTSDTKTVGGTAYKLAAVTNAAWGSADTLNTSYTLSLDKYGYVVAVDSVESDEVYAFVLDEDSNRAQDEYTLSLKLLFADGSKKWVDVASIDEDEVDEDNYNTNYTEQFVSYTEADGKYNVYLEGADDVSGTVEKNTVTAFTDKKISSETVGLFYKKADKTYTVYNGISKMPTTATVTTAKALLDGNVVLMFVVDDFTTTDNTEQVFVYRTPTSESKLVKGDEVFVMKALVNGEDTTIDTTHADVAAGLYLNPVYDQGVFDKANNTAVVGSVAHDHTYIAFNTSMDVTLTGGVMTVTNNGSKTDFVVADNCKYYEVDLEKADSDGNVGASSFVEEVKLGKTATFDASADFILNAGDYVVVVLTDDDLATQVYVVHAPV